MVSELPSCSLVRLLCHCTTCHSLIPAREVYIPCDSSCNNGVCDYTCGTCVCHPFYTGEHCDRPLSECGSHDSHACIYLRVTLALTTGASLFPVLPCGNYYCFNEGTCEVDGSGREYCRCPQGFSGDYCLVNTGSECFTCNRASFIPGQDGFSAKFFYPLPSNAACFCMNGGTCVTRANLTTCTCPDGFLGSRCEIQLCKSMQAARKVLWPAGVREPFNHSLVFINIYSCHSEAGNEELCAECGGYFCLNGGTCWNNTCQCTEGFGGDFCQFGEQDALSTCSRVLCVEMLCAYSTVPYRLC